MNDIMYDSARHTTLLLLHEVRDIARVPNDDNTGNKTIQQNEEEENRSRLERCTLGKWASSKNYGSSKGREKELRGEWSE